MKKFIPLIALALLAIPFALHAEEKAPAEKPAEKAPAKAGKFKWYTSIKAARKAAAEEKKPIVMLFTGSDWCPYCVKLEKEILTSKEFKAWAAGSAILFVAESKGGPGNESAEHRKVRDEFAKGSGYPTVIITDSAGKALGKTGYTRAAPADYVKYLDAIIGAKGA